MTGGVGGPGIGGCSVHGTPRRAVHQINSTHIVSPPELLDVDDPGVDISIQVVDMEVELGVLSKGWRLTAAIRTRKTIVPPSGQHGTLI